MAKKSKPTQILTKKQLSRKEREDQQRRVLYIIAGITALAVLVVLAVGFYREYVQKPAAPIATVNDKPISTRDYQAMVQYRRFELNAQTATINAQLAQLDPTNEEQQFLVTYLQQQLQQVQSQNVSLPTVVLDNMIEDELIRQEAARRNITVTAQEVQDEIEMQFGFVRNPPTPTPTPITATVAITVTPTPTVAAMTEAEFQTNYNEYVLAVRQQAGFSENAFRRLFESSLYREKLGVALGEEVPTTAEQVRARHILVDTEEEALKVVERLEAGEDFAALAKELSKDTSSEDGDLGWFPRGQMVTEFEDAAFALEPGQISTPISTTFGYHIIQLIERETDYPLDEVMLEQNKSMALDNWLQTQMQLDVVKRYWSSDKVPPAK